MSQNPNLEEKIQLQTVNHKLRTALLFGLFAGIISAVVLYLGLQ